MIGASMFAASLLFCSATIDCSHNIVRPAREIEAPAAWSYKSSPSSRVRCQWDGVPGPASILDQSRTAAMARREGVASAQDKGSRLPCSSFAMGNATPEACAPATAGPGVRPGQCSMVRAWPAGATFTPVVPTMLTSEREPACAVGDDRVTRLSATRRPAFLPLAPPTPGRLNHPLAAGPESVLVSSVGTTTPEVTPEGGEPGRDVPAPPDADLANEITAFPTPAPVGGELRGSDPGPLSPAADTGGVALPRLRLWFRDEADGPGSWTSDPVPVERIADDFGRDLGWIAFGVSLDLGSTSAALRWCKTCREGNPFGWDSEARFALKLTMATSSGTVCWWLRRNGHGRAATIARWVTFGIQALAAANNAHHAVRGR